MPSPDNGLCRRMSRLALCGLAVTLTFASLPLASATEAEKHATDADSQEKRWSHIDPSRYHDVIRKTDRVTYPDAHKVPATSCDATGDGLADMIFVDPELKRLAVVPYIPYGSATNEVIRSIADQPEVIFYTAPAGVEHFGDQIACVPTGPQGKAVVAVSADQSVILSELGKSPKGGEIPVQASVALAAIPTALAGMSSTFAPDDRGFAVAAGDAVHYFATVPTSGSVASTDATASWTGAAITTLASVGYVAGDAAPAIAASDSAHGVVWLIPANAESKPLADAGVAITAGAGQDFGSALTGVGDINEDGIDDVAIGAPLANGRTGAVSIVYGSGAHLPVSVNTAAMTESAVLRDGKAAGTLIRQPARGRIGSALAFVTDDDHPGALVVGRPDNEEHPGALVISATALKQNWSVGRGIDDIPTSQKAWLASEDGDAGDGGLRVGIVARRGTDKLTTIYTGDAAKKVDVWTIDLSHQGEAAPTDPVEPTSPKPADPSAEPGMTPLDQTDVKSWLGEFTSGMGGSLARGACDVTGDGQPDIVSGGAPRSEWKYDPYYADSTPTKGWVFTVTGQVQVIPGGTPGTALPDKRIITINGPRETADPGTDAAIGLSVACLGDTNGDHIDDSAVTSFSMSRVWIIFGGSDLAATDLNTLTASRGRMIALPAEGAPGFQVTRIGDLDGDGLAEVGFVVANARLAAGDFSTNAGAAFVVRGSKDPTTVDLTNIDAPNSAVMLRVDLPERSTLSSFAPVGDVNGDQQLDFVLADFNHFTANAVPGHAWVVYGDRTQTRINLGDAFAGYQLFMADDHSYRLGAGTSTTGVGDVDGDGIGDFIIGFDGGEVAHQAAGGVALVHGTKAIIDKRVINPTKAVARPRIAGAQAGAARSRMVRLDTTTESNDPTISVIVGNAAGSGFGYAADAQQDGPGASRWVAVGAWGEGDGTVYRFKAGDIPPGITAVSDLGDKVVTTTSTGPQARFGRSVAFVGNYLGAPTLAAGGDGVIDIPGHEGYSHTAHVMAMAIADVPDIVMPGENPVAPAAPGTEPGAVPAPVMGVEAQREALLARTGARYSLTIAALAGCGLALVGVTLLGMSRRRSTH
ncbi:MAG: integrin alpha [Propionibacteriaceae bacterium]